MDCDNEDSAAAANSGAIEKTRTIEYSTLAQFQNADQVGRAVAPRRAYKSSLSATLVTSGPFLY